MINSSTGAPDTYASLYESYFGMMKAIVRKAGIHAGDVDDVASEILCKFMEKDALTWFDADRVFDAGENPRTKGGRYRQARFSNLLRRFTSLYCRQWMDKQKNLAHREPEFAKLNAPVGDDGATWGEANQDRWQSVDMESSVASHVVLASALTTAEVRALVAAERAEDSAQETVWELRKQAQDVARDAHRHHVGMQAIVQMAAAGESITGASLGRTCGWSSRVGSEVLRGVRSELRAVGL